MRTLVYKRTHSGDPDKNGVFGIRDCMGRVRSLEFEAVVGVGGQGAQGQINRLAGKVNWIGIGAHNVFIRGIRDPLVRFDHFLDFGTGGPDLRAEAPKLAERRPTYRGRGDDGFH
jgi:hypothetical protein